MKTFKTTKIQAKLNNKLTQISGTLNGYLYSTSANGQAMQLPMLPLKTADSWEFETVYTYNGGGNYPTVIAPSTQSYGLVMVIINGAFYVSLSSDGTNTDICSETTGITVTTGTTYYIKFGFNGSQYYFKYNTDGSNNYTAAWVKNSTTKVYSNIPLWLMNWGYTNTTRWSSGQMNLFCTKFYINGSLYFSCVEYPTLMNAFVKNNKYYVMT